MRLSRADSRNGRKGETATENGRVSVRLLESARQTDRAFDYLIPEDMHISPGAIVTVPFGRQNRLVSAVADRVYYPGGAPDASDGPKPDGEAAADGAGYGAAKQKNAVQYGAAADRRGAGDGGEISDGGDIAEGAPRLKYVASVINSASLTPELLSLAHFMRARTLCTFGDAVKTMLPSAALSNISEIYFAAEEDASVPPQSAPVYAFVRENSPVTADALYAKFGRGVQPVLAKLSAKGAIIRRRQDHEPTNVKHETVFGLAADRAEAERAMNGEGEYALRGNSEKSWGSNWGSVDCTWNSSTLFANLYYDFRNDSAFVPYIGAGIGMSFNYLGFDLHRGGSAVSRDEHTTNFAWNVGAGVAYNVNDALYIDAAYRYVDLGYTEASGSLNGDQIKVGSRPYNHEFMLGLRFAF